MVLFVSLYREYSRHWILITVNKGLFNTKFESCNAKVDRYGLSFAKQLYRRLIFRILIIEILLYLFNPHCYFTKTILLFYGQCYILLKLKPF